MASRKPVIAQLHGVWRPIRGGYLGKSHQNIQPSCSYDAATFSKPPTHPSRCPLHKTKSSAHTTTPSIQSQIWPMAARSPRRYATTPAKMRGTRSSAGTVVSSRSRRARAASQQSPQR